MTHWFNGGLDDVRLYDRALDDAEVATLYKSAGGTTPTRQAEQDGADEPATAPESKSEGKKYPDPESEMRPK
jgi:hypothetical protein